MSDDLIVSAAERAATGPFYLAGPIRGWQRLHRATAEQVLAHLGAAVDRHLGAEQQLARLALCRRPTDREDLAQIAARFGVVPARLAALVLEADRPRRAPGAVGERHGRAVMTLADVRDFRRRVHGGESIYSVATSSPFSLTTIRDAVHGRTWGHVTDPPPVGDRTRSKRWTAEEVAYIVAHNDDPAADVAAALGKSTQAVTQQRHRRRLL